MSEILSMMPLLVGAGILAGLLAGLLGVGGGIVLVPVLYFIFSHLGMASADAMALATGTSLAAIVPTSISSIRSHSARDNVNWDLIKAWVLWILLGVFAGATLLSQWQSQWFVLLFALIALWVSFRIFFASQVQAGVMPKNAIQRAVASVIGGLSVMIGIGGGTLGVPILSKFGFAAHKAVGTSAVFGLIIALPGALMMLAVAQTPENSPTGAWGAIHLPSLLLIVPLTVLLAPVGVKLGKKLNPATLKKVFAVVLFITSLRMMYGVFSGL